MECEISKGQFKGQSIKLAAINDSGSVWEVPDHSRWLIYRREVPFPVAEALCTKAGGSLPSRAQFDDALLYELDAAMDFGHRLFWVSDRHFGATFDELARTRVDCRGETDWVDISEPATVLCVLPPKASGSVK
jgi:hypothetical protein